jgi:UDP-3-O-[3-hydroxymyristoyl] glucosamine N-acyltransferase LpxD
MTQKEKNTFNALSTDIANFLDLQAINIRKFEILNAKPPDNLSINSVTLLTRTEEFEELFKDAPDDVLAIIPSSLKEKAKPFQQFFLFSDNPRLSYAKVLIQFFDNEFVPAVSESASVNSDGKIQEEVSIGSNVVINGKVDIGKGTQIKDNVVIEGRVSIGNNVLIKSGTIIGQKGFNFVRDEKNLPIPFAHFGKVIIGNNVELGALNTVVQGTLSDTIVSDYVKTDDHVHIAHNVKVGRCSLITAHAEISGSVTIGENCWLGPNCSIIDHITIGNNVFIGIGAVVTKSLEDNILVVGNPARKLKDI